VQVYYYGHAHPETTPLAIIRRERTNFFTSGGLLLEPAAVPDSDINTLQPAAVMSEVATVGAPAEGFKKTTMRIDEPAQKKRAQSLIAWWQRDGGLSEWKTSPGIRTVDGKWLAISCILTRLRRGIFKR
jgi:hypothetical protein